MHDDQYQGPGGPAMSGPRSEAKPQTTTPAAHDLVVVVEKATGTDEFRAFDRWSCDRPVDSAAMSDVDWLEWAEQAVLETARDANWLARRYHFTLEVRGDRGRVLATLAESATEWCG